MTPDEIQAADAATLATWLAGLECSHTLTIPCKDCGWLDDGRAMHLVTQHPAQCGQCHGTGRAVSEMSQECPCIQYFDPDYIARQVPDRCGRCLFGGSHVADCTRCHGAGRTLLPPEAQVPAAEAALSHQPRLWWSYHHQPTGTDYYTVTLQARGEWREATFWCRPDRHTAALRTLALALVARSA